MWLITLPSGVNARTVTRSAAFGAHAAAYPPERRSTIRPSSASTLRRYGRQNAARFGVRGSRAPIDSRYAGMRSSGWTTPHSALAISTRCRASVPISGSPSRSNNTPV